jgi:Tol biopolymer transport system component
MPEESSARVGSAVLVWMLRSLLLAAALVCALALPPAGRAGALRPAAGLAAATPSRDAGRGVIAFEADGDIYVAEVGGGTPTKIVDSHVVGGINMQPALSPDASHVAFSGQREGKFSIYIVGVDGEGLRRLTYSNDDDTEPAWSPDGSQIAFVGGRKGDDVDVYLISWDGIGPLVHFTSDSREGSSPSWAEAPTR